MAQITDKTFNKVLAGVLKGAVSMRNNLQDLIAFGIEQYAQHRNASYLTSIMVKTVGVKSIPTVTIKDYIKEHANLKWVKLSDNTHGFKMNGDNVEVKPLEVTWYEWKGAKHNNVRADMDVVAQAKAFLTRLEKALKEGHVKDKDAASKVEKALVQALTA